MPGAYFSRRNVLFDLDGTLVDSAPAHARAFVAALEQKRPELARDFDYAPFAGQPTRDVFLALGIANQPELGELTARKQKLYREALERGEIRAFPGAENLLARLREQGRRLFLVTGASGVSARRILELAKLDVHFEGLVTADEAARGKPWPDPYLFALERHGLARAESVAIEDGDHGIASARAAKLDVVTVHGENRFPGVAHARNLEDLNELLLP